ncbi:MAG: hypothetical protein AABY75_05730 [Bacteroidota bacterium]
MKIIRTRPTRLMYFPVDGNGAAIVEGAVLMPGVTDEDDRSVLIRATGAAADAVGILQEPHATADDAAPNTGSKRQTNGVESSKAVMPFLPGCEVEALMANDADNDVDVASATSTVLTITNVEDDIDGSWIYVRAGTGVGLVLYCKESAAGTMTLKSASTTTLDNTSKLLIMRRRFHQLVSIDSTGTKISSSAAAGTLPWRVLKNEYRFSGEEGWIELDPALHHNLLVPDTTCVQFRQVLSPADTLFSPLN